MSDKKQLEEIEKRVLIDKVYYKYIDGTKGHWGKTYTLNEEDYKWLIKQAERVQKLEQWGFETKPYIKSLEQQNKRYREALEEILTLKKYNETDNFWDDDDDFYMYIQNTVEKALEGEQ